MSRTATISGAIWAVAAAAALLAPAPAGTVLDGIPLDGRLEAIVIGMVVPLLFVLEPRVFDRVWARGLVAAIGAAKLAAILLLTTNGLCTQFRTDGPVNGPVSTIELTERSGMMRTWDVRAHWGGGTPRCSAITRRDYPSRDRFPAWFVNVLDNAEPPHRETTLVMRGVVTAAEPGALSFETVPAPAATLAVNGRSTTATAGRLEVPLTPGSHQIEFRIRLAGEEWRVVPSWNGRSLWSSALVTVDEPSSADRVLWRVLPLGTAVLVLAFIGCWVFTAIRLAPVDPRSLACVAAIAAGAGLCASIPAAARFAPLVIGLAAALPAARRDPNWRTAMWLIGLPWLVCAGLWAAPRVGEFTIYSRGDDWLTYQVSAYRIYLQGYWFEAGEKLFYYQPLYRWIAGALHLIFGDSSAGELFWDGACLLLGALLAFVLSRPWLGGRGALVVATATLALFTLTPIWYLIGRGLAEISAAGFAWAAALLLIQAQQRGPGLAFTAGLFGVLAFYSRLNHMLFAGTLVIFLLPLTMPARALRTPMRVVRSIRVTPAAIYLGTLGFGVTLLSLRAWLYAGEFSPFAGTSFGLNYTGLAPDTMFSGRVWQNVFHSLFAHMIVNEVFDARGLLVYIGCVAALLAILQVPGFARLPLVTSLALIGALAGAIAAHAHGYPGRFSVHLVPLATTTALIAALRLPRTRLASQK